VVRSAAYLPLQVALGSRPIWAPAAISLLSLSQPRESSNLPATRLSIARIPATTSPKAAEPRVASLLY